VLTWALNLISPPQQLDADFRWGEGLGCRLPAAVNLPTAGEGKNRQAQSRQKIGVEQLTPAQLCLVSFLLWGWKQSSPNEWN